MTKPMPMAAFVRTPTARTVSGLPATIDAVAEVAAPSHRFLRRGWFAAAVAAYGGEARTVLVEEGGRPVFALPLIARGPRAVRVAMLAGSYWPFRSFPLARGAGSAVLGAGLDALAATANAVRIGPVQDDDPAVAPLLAAARARGWAVIDRFVADSWLLDIGALTAAGQWPRGSTLRKNRFHEKHLAERGTLDWSFLGAGDWPRAFDLLAGIEAASWIGSATDGRDAKFTATGHGAFWRGAADDPVLARMFHAALLRVAGTPAAFSFDVVVGETTYAIANSFHPAYAKQSPGKLLYWRNLARAAAAGTRTVDWGAGDGGYKRVIGAEQGPALRDWLIVRPGLPAAIAHRLRGLWRRSGQG